MGARVDHLVVAAARLDEGVAWCEATLGVVPEPGGEHPLMGTHNRLLRIATAAWPRGLIEWGSTHPAPGLPESGVTLQLLGASHPAAARLRAAWAAIGLENVALTEGPANLCALLETPRGRVRLESQGL